MRSKILDILNDKEWTTTSGITGQVDVTSSTVKYHLRNMEREEIVERDGTGKGWKIIPVEQIELTEFLQKKSTKK